MIKVGLLKKMSTVPPRVAAPRALPIDTPLLLTSLTSSEENRDRLPVGSFMWHIEGNTVRFDTVSYGTEPRQHVIDETFRCKSDQFKASGRNVFKQMKLNSVQ